MTLADSAPQARNGHGRHGDRPALAGMTLASAAHTVEGQPTQATARGPLGSPAPDGNHDWLAHDRPARYENVLSTVRVPMRDGSRTRGNVPGAGLTCSSP
ncbi:hypothetical protein O1M63_36840 [Streptomyces mirabilis]|nr:hypothetical protein [Streptomyces mirabilis]